MSQPTDPQTTSYSQPRLIDAGYADTVEPIAAQREADRQQYRGASFSAPLPIVDATPPSTQRPKRRLRGLFWVAVLCSIALVMAGLVSAVVTYLDEAKPGGVVQRYFAALSRGDAPAALGYGSVGSGSVAMLTEPVLRAQLAAGRIGDVSVLAEAHHGADVDVDVQYALTTAGKQETVTDTITLVPHGRSWRLKSSAVPVQVAFSGAASRITVAGASVPMGRQLMFPGATPFIFDTKNLELSPQSRIVRFASMPSPLTVELSVAGSEAAGAALDNAFSGCLKGSAPTVALCPMPSDSRAVPGTFRGTTTKRPSVNAVFSVTSSVDGVVQENATIPVTGTYSQLDFNNLPNPKSFTGSIVLMAHASALTPDKVVWDVA